jgi:hypothetical protein
VPKAPCGQIEGVTAGERLRKSFIGQHESPDSPGEAGIRGNRLLNIDLGHLQPARRKALEKLDQFPLDELALLISLLERI